MWGIPQATVIQNSYFDWLKGSVRTDNKRRTRLFSGANIQKYTFGCIFFARKFTPSSVSLESPEPWLR